MTSVRRAEARTDDPAAIDRLLELLPDPGAVRLAIQAGGAVFDQIWHRDTHEDHWIDSDGSVLRCYTVTGLTVQEAFGVRRWWQGVRESTPGIELDLQALIEIVEGVTGSEVE